jgi:hypothetical protein
MVSPASVVLSDVLDPYKSTGLYQQLAGSGILSMECYFDTLFLETSGAVLFAAVDYDYGTASITSVFDNNRTKNLSADFRFDKNWFFSVDKKVVTLFTQTSGTMFYPVLMELDLPSRSYKKIFPIGSKNNSNLIEALDGINPKQVSRGSVYHNGDQNTFLITYSGVDGDDRMFVVDLYIRYEDQLMLTKVDLYRDVHQANVVSEPPVVLSPYLSAISASNSFVVQVSALNNPFSYSLMNYTTSVSAITANGYGEFSGNLPSGLHHINYTVSNQIGDSIYCLTLVVS